ncbi:Gfo/Idh/MocA family protein [Lacibacterium aquatile]|uniref:Gfo/Idh/MocA family protein n=1 Tax=Lacibacterium aquatile TaxID=1168082 RepID=A0ABW5DUE8_9PROT
MRSGDGGVPVKIILAGSSHWHAGMHLDAARSCDAEIIGVWDESPDKAQAFASAHGLKAISTFDGVLKGGADLVVLMGHPSAVPARARQLIEADMPLMLEKPATSQTARLAELADLARRQNLFISVPLPNRFGPVFTALSDLKSADRAGPLAHAHFRLVNGPPERYAADGVAWVVDPDVGGGGALRNLGIHGVDAALSMAQGKLRLISSSIGNRIHTSPVEDHALLVLEDEAGALFTVEAGYTYASLKPGGDFEWRVVTSNATLIDRGDSALCATLDDGVSVALAPEPTATRYRLCMRDTLDKLARGEAPTISLNDYVAAMSLIDDAYGKAGR